MKDGTLIATRAAIIATLIAVVAWIANLFVLKGWGTEDRGTFGDMFGVVNSAFSGLAFIGIVYAIFLQRHEIEIARTDAAYTKTILDEQKRQLELQNAETKKQAFENTFFQLIRLLTDVTSQISINTEPPTMGKDAFRFFLYRLRENFKHDGRVLYEDYNILESFNEAYEAFYKQWNSELGHYFRTVYNIVKFIDNSDIENKSFYSNILRAQISNDEAALLFHNGLSPYGREKFKPYIEKYALLKNVTDKQLLNKDLRSFYSASAFGTR